MQFCGIFLFHHSCGWKQSYVSAAHALQPHLQPHLISRKQKLPVASWFKGRGILLSEIKIWEIFKTLLSTDKAVHSSELPRCMLQGWTQRSSHCSWQAQYPWQNISVPPPLRDDLYLKILNPQNKKRKRLWQDIVTLFNGQTGFWVYLWKS